MPDVQEIAIHVQAIANVTNCFSANVAILDRETNVVAVNEAWRQFAKENDYEKRDKRVGLGTNYLRLCEGVRGDAQFDAQKVADGLRNLLNGSISKYQLQYPCHSQNLPRWFRATFAQVEGQPFILAVHENVTEIVAVKTRVQEQASLVRSPQPEQLALIHERINRLTKRHRQVFQLVVLGHTNKEIAARMKLTEKTVEFHRHQVMRTMQAASSAELVRMGVLAEIL